MSRPHEPNELSRQRVKDLSAFGIRQESIAKMVGVSVPTLEKYYRDELDTGLDEANAQVANTLFQMAISGQSPSSTFFWLKTRGGWRETDKSDNNGKEEVCFTNDLAE
jgi:hypothetical protein